MSTEVPEPPMHAKVVDGISPSPTPEETAAIVAAVEAMWPRAAAESASGERRPTWRFSGRWWARPLASRRDRPFR